MRPTSSEEPLRKLPSLRSMAILIKGHLSLIPSYVPKESWNYEVIPKNDSYIKLITVQPVNVENSKTKPDKDGEMQNYMRFIS